MAKRRRGGCMEWIPVRWSMALLSMSLLAIVDAAPVSRDVAFKAATLELPVFYPGTWNPAGEIPLRNLAGNVVAYTFMFVEAQKLASMGQDRAPAAFVKKARTDLAAKGASVSGYETELRGDDCYATIVISADDTEPPVLRCFRGLPPQVVREADALALAGGKSGAGSWRVRDCLMLGFFDEAFTVEPTIGSGEALIVDLRSRATVTEKEARTRALAKKAAAPDPELVRMSQQAWGAYRASSRVASAAVTGTATAVKPLKEAGLNEKMDQMPATDPAGRLP